jgi:hypothetical protein
VGEKELIHAVQSYPAWVRRIAAPRPQSNSNFSPPTSTRIAEPNRSALGKGVPVPSSVTLITGADMAMPTLLNINKQSPILINRIKHFTFLRKS